MAPGRTVSGQPRVPLAAAVATLLSVVCAAWLPSTDRPGDVVLWLAAAFLPYAVLVASDTHLEPRVSLLLAGVAVLLLVPPLPPLSDDVYRFVWDGHVARHGIDPYRYAPEHHALYDLRDEHFPHVNHPDIPTIYPPLAQLAFAALGALWHDPRMPKLAAGACLLGVGVLLTRRGQPRAAGLLVLNPLALSESALNGHLDIAVGGALLLATWALAAGRSLRGSLWLAAATGLKMVGLVLAPLAGTHRRAGALVAAALCGIVLAPQLWPRGEGMGGAGHYARRWQGNAGGFLLLRSGCEAALGALASDADRARHHIRLPALAPLLTRLEGSPLDPWRGALGPKKSVPDRTDFEIHFLAGLLARGLAVGLVAALVWGAVVVRAPPLRAARFVLFVLLWLAPQVHPWYLMWVLPLEAALGGLAVTVWSALSLVAYAPLEPWLRERIWFESGLIQALEYGTVGLVLACEPWLRAQPGHATPGLTPPHTPTY